MNNLIKIDPEPRSFHIYGRKVPMTKVTESVTYTYNFVKYV